MRTYTIGRNEKAEAIGLVLLALWCFAFGFGIGRLIVRYELWEWFVKWVQP